MSSEQIDLSAARILIVDDVPANLEVLWKGLEEAGYQVMVATGGERALEIAVGSSPELILLDVMMPGMDGFETCRRLQAIAATRSIPVIFITAQNEVSGIVEGFAAGGIDYVTKPFHNEEVLVRVRTHLERAYLLRTLAQRNAALEEELARRRRLTDERDRLSDRLALMAQREAVHWGIKGLVGNSQSLQKILHDISLLQQSQSASLLITGESGTGKEMIARAFHAASKNAAGPFVAVNCAGVPAELADSLFFGHRKGAFTGAEKAQNGYFSLAHGGTLFLDEVGDMPQSLQAKLLRVLEDGHVRPLGEGEDRRVEVRVVAATNADLQAKMASGVFRQDLYYRLARFTVEVPPLRQRREDIALLVRHFLHIFAAEMGIEPPVTRPDALVALEAYDYPGNIRQLRNIVERAVLESRGADIEVHHLTLGSAAVVASSVEVGTLIPLAEVERRHILQVLERQDWVIKGRQGAAAVLGLHEGTLRSRMKKLGIRRPAG